MDVQSIFNLMFEKGYYNPLPSKCRMGVNQSRYMCIALEEAFNDGVISKVEFNLSVGEIAKFLGDDDPDKSIFLKLLGYGYDLSMKQLRALCGVILRNWDKRDYILDIIPTISYQKHHIFDDVFLDHSGNIINFNSFGETEEDAMESLDDCTEYDYGYGGYGVGVNVGGSVRFKIPTTKPEETKVNFTIEAKALLSTVKESLPQAVKNFMEGEPVIAGGFVRDTIAGVKPKDLDVIVSCPNTKINNKDLTELLRDRGSWLNKWCKSLEESGYQVKVIPSYSTGDEDSPPEKSGDPLASLNGKDVVVQESSRFAKAYHFVIKAQKEDNLDIDILVCKDSTEQVIKDFDCNLNQYSLDGKGKIKFWGNVPVREGLDMLDSSRANRAQRMKDFYNQYYNKF